MNDSHAIHGLRTRWPHLPEACVVPYAAFTNAAYYQQEQERIFRGDTWNFIGLEAEIPKPGDFKATQIGDTPVIITRDELGAVNVLQNRCAHRGALVCREPRGNAARLQCVYHQWAYDLRGNLLSVPFRRGVRGKGGMPSGFELGAH
ncbi:MAG: Rieske 2Fe-2S domain-containing protein, partial [Gammaproteobacteria bacterium]